MSKEAMKLALKKAFQLGQDYWYQADHDSYRENNKSDETLAKFRQLVDETCEALAEQSAQQEPVATLFGSLPVYDTSPPAQRTWVGLTDEEKRQIFEREDYQGWLDYINAIEAKLRSKNEDRN